jgi:hypothetical protein
METLIAYPNAIKRAEAFQLLDNGEVWGPLWPFVPFDANTIGHARTDKSTLPPGQSFPSYVQASAGGYTVERPALNAGEYHPRIWRRHPDIERFGEPVLRVENTPYLGPFTHSLEQVECLFEDFVAIFRVVHPTPDNLDAYGGEIRSLLILACTEVEAQWKGVLQANGVTSASSTNDYVRVLPVLKLEWYSVRLTRYPHLPLVAPFKGWKAASPTQSLPWYQAYNNVKHDREAHFKQATLQNALASVAACAVMLGAQFGVEALHRHRLSNLFEFRERPQWEPGEWYYAGPPGTAWREVQCVI